MFYNQGVAVVITGISGQDGSYLAEQLLAAGERLVGLIMPAEKLPPYVEQMHRLGSCEFVHCDLADPAALRHFLRTFKPSRVFHLAAISQPAACEANPVLSRTVNVTSVEVLCDWVRREQPSARVLLSSSSAIFGDGSRESNNEASAISPINEYGRQKAQVREIAAHGRAEGHYIACAIPFNHESERRPEQFVFAKICNSAARISKRRQESLSLGDTSSVRDWGYAPEYVTAMRWMLEIEQPTELVLASGEGHSVAELVQTAFGYLDLDVRRYVSMDPALVRKADPHHSVGNPAKAWEELGWEATTRFEALVQLMIDAELTRLE